MMARIINRVVGRPKLTLLAVGIITVFFGYYVPRVKFTSAVDDFFISGDPDKEFFMQVKRVFGDDGVTVIAMVSPAGEDVFSAARITKLARVTDAVAALAGVRKVLSLTNVQRIFGSGMMINVKPLMAKVPETAEEWAALKGALGENTMYDRNLVSADRRTAAVNVFLEDLDADQSRYYEIMDEISAILNRESGPEKFYVSGIAATSTEIHRAILRDLKRFVPLMFALITVILLISFRSVRGVVLPLATVVITTIWTIGFMGVMAIPIGMVTMVLPPQIIAIGNAYTIYVLSDYLEELTDQGSAAEIVASTVRRAALPLALCGLTTVIGFGSLLWNNILSLQEMGIASAVGVSFAVLLALTVTPAVLALLPKQRPRREDPESGEKKPGLMDQLVESLAEFDIRRRIPILAASALIALIAAIGMFRIEFDTDFLTFFSKDDPVTVSNQVQQKYLAGAAPFLVILDAGKPDAFKDPALLRKMELFQNWMTEKIAGVDLTMAVTDYVKLLNKVFHKNDPAAQRLPETRKEVAQLLLFYSFSGNPNDFAPYVTSDYSRANIMVRSRIVGSTATNQAVARIEEYAKTLFGPDAKVKVSGTIPLVNKSAVAIASGQMKSLASSVILIFLVMALLFLSVKVGLIAMVPNALPILVLFGFMGYFGITINLSTALISCIAIGLVVDDTIHILARYNDELKTAIDPDEAMKRTLRVMSKPALFTSVSLFFGFSILGGSDFVPIRQFGLLTGMTVMVALLGDQVLLPALVSTVRVTTLWDHVGLGIGGEAAPVRLFQGLSPHQEKVATLMGVFGFYGPGEPVVKQGDVVKDLFIVLSGGVKATRNGASGKAAGAAESVALVPSGFDFGCIPGDEPRPSPVSWIAEPSAKILMLNPMTLDRLRTAHPQIAERIEHNLAKTREEATAREKRLELGA
ncbi:MAG TPA: efflux RND transporter permease subunit [bacterium]|nr:efflux RND transporter permease subunit [bacterium]